MISPNYPNPYPHDSQCVYTVTVHPHEVMNLTFTDLDLETETQGSCEWDYVEVSEQNNSVEPWFYSFKLYIYTTVSIYVIYSSDSTLCFLKKNLISDVNSFGRIFLL